MQNQAENIDFTAYHQNGIDSAYEIAAKISMKRSGVPAGTSGRFYKAGLIPYYLDENNQVSVWLQQWGNDGFSRITANGRLNGQNLSGANGAGYWEPQELIFDTVLPVSKAETFTLKFVVTEKKIEIYLDGERLGELTPAEGNILLPGRFLRHGVPERRRFVFGYIGERVRGSRRAGSGDRRRVDVGSRIELVLRRRREDIDRASKTTKILLTMRRRCMKAGKSTLTKFRQQSA